MKLTAGVSKEFATEVAEIEQARAARINVDPDADIKPLVALSPAAWDFVLQLLIEAGAHGVAAAVNEQLAD